MRRKSFSASEAPGYGPGASIPEQPVGVPYTLQEISAGRSAGDADMRRSSVDSAMTNGWSGLADAAVQRGLLTRAEIDDIVALAHAGTLPQPWDCFHDHRLDTASFAVLHLGMRDAIAARLGLTPDALQAEVRAGHSAAQLAHAHNTTEQALSNAAIMAARKCLEQAVHAGTWSHARANEIYTCLDHVWPELFNRLAHEIGS